MRIVYPYNEILPKKRAHDVFIFEECAALARCGLEVTLLCGRGSADVFSHYHVPKGAFQVKQLPIIRKNNPLNLSWNAPFFYFSQRHLREVKPNWVFLSVHKQGAYHLARKIPEVRYLYEVHELAYYPHMHHLPQAFHLEKKMLEQVDLITVTTHALKEILQTFPYALKVPIEVVPLAVNKERLPPPKTSPTLNLMYVGQLYKGQGVERLLDAIADVEGVTLTIVGGREEEIEQLKKKAPSYVTFLGYVQPQRLAAFAQEAHAFVAPFDRSSRMPYVAHTKLFEYAQWGRPFIAPDMPIVREHFCHGNGVLLYEPDNTEALTACIAQLKKDLSQLQQMYLGKFDWKKRAEKYQELLR